MTFDGIKIREWKEVMEGFRQLRKEYDWKLRKLEKESHCRVDFRRDKAKLAEEVLSVERFSKILPKDMIMTISNAMSNDLIISENTLYTFTDIVLDRIAPNGYKIDFWYTGRCPSCGCDKEAKIPRERPVMDQDFVDNLDYFNHLSEYVKCDSCNVMTHPVKTSNVYTLEGKNDYNLNIWRTRLKSEGRKLTKFVQLCSGKKKDLKDVRDIIGGMAVCGTEKDCRKVPEILIKYDGDNEVECKDYFVVGEVKDKSGTRYESEEYRLYLKGGKLKRKDVHPIEAKKLDREFYKAMHIPIMFSGIPISVHIKDMEIWEKENDPESPLFHGTYSQKRPDCTRQYHEERMEREMTTDRGEFEERCQGFLMSTGVFTFNPKLYQRDMLLW